MNSFIKPKYLSTAKAAIYFDLEQDWLFKRKKENQFIKNKHYIQKNSYEKILWNIEEIEKWFMQDENEPEDIKIDIDKLIA